MRNKKWIIAAIIFAAIVAMVVLIFVCVGRDSGNVQRQSGGTPGPASSMEDSGNGTDAEPGDEAPEDGGGAENAGEVAGEGAAETGSGTKGPGEAGAPNGSTAQNHQGLTVGDPNDAGQSVDFSELSGSETETQPGPGENSQDRNDTSGISTSGTSTNGTGTDGTGTNGTGTNGNDSNGNGANESDTNGNGANENDTNGDNQEEPSDSTESEWGPLYSSEGEVGN